MQSAERRAHGSSLVEALVSTALFGVAFAVALVEVHSMRRMLESGQRRVELQQALRIGLHHIVRDVRAAGLAVRSHASWPGPDERVELALAGAIVLRADLDGRSAEASEPEWALSEGGPFGNVTTGNDEIVGYVLGKQDGSSPDTLVFEADVKGVPRDGVVETVAVGGVALDHDDPPYTLYRLTVRPDSTKARRSPVMDHVRSLRFTYFDAFGSVIQPPGGVDDPASKQARADIRRIGISIEGAVSASDLRWTDPEDPDSTTRQRRKFSLTTELSPRNLAFETDPPD